MLSDRTLAFGEELARALLGLDALYRAEPANDEDGLVVVNMAPTHAPEPFADYDAARARFAELERAADPLPEPDRRRYYQQVCASSLAFIRWRRGDLPFREQLAGFLHVAAEPADTATLDGLRAQLRALLTAMGYDGDLAAQCAAWEARNRVKADEVEGEIGALLDQAWERTAARMPLPDPKTDGMRVATVSGVAFNARCDYLRRTVELNIDPVLTRPALKHLVVHECYPGHYVQFKLRETWYQEGTAAADGLLSVVNTASSCTFEGIADHGMRLLDWVEGDDDRVAALLTHYRAGIGTVAAWQLHALGWSETRVAGWLRAHALVGGEGWVANRLRFFAAPARGVLIWSYWHGEPSVASVWDRVPVGQRADFLRFLYGRMHSPQSVALFA